MSTIINTTNLWQNLLASNPHKAQIYNNLKRLHRLKNKKKNNTRDPSFKKHFRRLKENGKNFKEI
jgi:hypothetical protein